MNLNRLAPLAAACALTFAAVADPHTTDRFTPEAAAESSAVSPPFPALFTSGDCQSFRFIASQVWPEIDTPAGPSWAWVTRIMWRESRCLPDAIGDSGNSFGLMQIHVPWRFWDKPIGWGAGPINVECGLTAREDLLNPATNLACARVLYNARGTYPWRSTR